MIKKQLKQSRSYKIPYGRQWVTEEDIAAVTEVLRADFLTQGPVIKEFEAAFATYVGSKYAVAVSSGTAALHLCALALGVKPADKVLTSPITFVASANCIRYCGGGIDLIDVDARTAVMDPMALKKHLEQSKEIYQGVVVVDYAGYPAQLNVFREVADEYGMWIIEDACHAPGAFFRDQLGQKQMSGNGKFADLSIFSFHPVKHIATGEGGMVTTNDPELYERLILFRTHGITRDRQKLNQDPGGWYYEMQELGFNYRLSEIHAALGLSQLTRLDESLESRRRIAKRYDEAFEGTRIKPLKGCEGHAYHLYVVQVPERKKVYDQLRAAGIFAQIHYIPVHHQPYYQDILGPQNLPNADAFYEACISLPMFPQLTNEEQTYVIHTLLDAVNRTSNKN